MTNKIPEHFENPIDNLLYKSIDKLNPILYRFGLTPNMITTISFIFGIISIYYFFNKSYILSSITFFISYYFDCADGKLARTYNMTSKFGDLYDHLTDYIVSFGIFYVIYKNKDIPSWFKYSEIGLILLLIIGMAIHMSYQESLYYNSIDSTDSSILNDIFSKVFKIDNHDNMVYTRYFGCGTFNLLISLIILLNKYIKK